MKPTDREIDTMADSYALGSSAPFNAMKGSFKAGAAWMAAQLSKDDQMPVKATGLAENGIPEEDAIRDLAIALVPLFMKMEREGINGMSSVGTAKMIKDEIREHISRIHWADLEKYRKSLDGVADSISWYH